MNALAGYLYAELRARGWGIDDLAGRSGLSRAAVLALLDPAEERSMLPDCETVEAVCTALEVDRTELVLAAAAACGLATGAVARPEPTLRTATNAELVRELQPPARQRRQGRWAAEPAARPGGSRLDRPARLSGAPGGTRGHPAGQDRARPGRTGQDGAGPARTWDTRG
jgi:hypothetical protein